MADLENYMLPCLNKKFLGFECMGCGLQRSFSLLLQGEFLASFKMYPAIYPLLLLLLVISINTLKPSKYNYKAIVILGIFTAAVMVVNFIIKTFLIK